ncbi:hypothetical protein IQ268_07085 [Oculatella sp. LEGE 06141]|uniref:hypothetical protein n=1 Tax=Oculatella sp. LEGE 06141 TaxID=1828648 RepID=UPI00188020FD|nr:hypothetical protein [Oculatella sp. LEGE 06141]MBE9178351.1 hypothetical protein [Oculatella sp. LEGE 06141]
MASEAQVRQYLAYWFQLGKKVVIHDGRETLLPQPVIQGDRYSAEFESCWQRVTASNSGTCYLEGTNQTIDELLSSRWDVSSCARCAMPVPQLNLGTPSLECPCTDLPGWPDTELPQPRSPVDSTDRLNQIRDRLLQVGRQSNSSSH